MPAEELPGEFHPCVSNFLSPMQRRTLPEPIANEIRASGLNIAGSVAAGFSPDGFTFAFPDDPQAGIVQSDAAWGKGATLRVCFLNGRSVYKDAVEHHAKLWSEVADVSFKFGVSKSQSDIRVTFNLAGFYSRLGMEARMFPDETMSLGFQGHEPDEEIRRLTLHEFGHALGFMHEHQHPESGIEWDERGAIAVYKPRLPPGMTDQAILAQLRAIPRNSFRYQFFRFDPKSIMMYAIPPQAVRPGTYRPEFGNNNTTLSDSDKVVVSTVYGPKEEAGGGATKLVVDGPPVAGSINSDGEIDLFYFNAPRLGLYEVLVLGDALVHVDVTDSEGKPPYEGDRGGDTTSPRLGLSMTRYLDAGRQNIRLTGSRFAAGFAQGTYTIRVRRAT